MPLIEHRERIDIALQCLNAAHTAFVSSTGEVVEELPSEVLELKNIIGAAFVLGFQLIDQCDDEKSDSVVTSIGNC